MSADIQNIIPDDIIVHRARVDGRVYAGRQAHRLVELLDMAVDTLEELEGLVLEKYGCRYAEIEYLKKVVRGYELYGVQGISEVTTP